MRPLLFAPHNDDETLFASFLILEYRPHVVVCYRSHIQEELYGVTAAAREAETAAAMDILGTTWEQWDFRDDDVSTLRLFNQMMRMVGQGYDHCFAPAMEAGGHAQHNEVCRLARSAFGDNRVTEYLTYTTGGVRSTSARAVPFHPWMVHRKLQALACYESQLETPSYVHFLEPLTEYVA